MSDVSGDSDREEEEEEGTAGIGVLDVIKAIAPLLVIIGLALGMLLFGYLFVPETLSSQNCTLHNTRWLYQGTSESQTFVHVS